MDVISFIVEKATLPVRSPVVILDPRYSYLKPDNGKKSPGKGMSPNHAYFADNKGGNFVTFPNNCINAVFTRDGKVAYMDGEGFFGNIDDVFRDLDDVEIEFGGGDRVFFRRNIQLADIEDENSVNFVFEMVYGKSNTAPAFSLSENQVHEIRNLRGGVAYHQILNPVHTDEITRLQALVTNEWWGREPLKRNGTSDGGMSLSQTRTLVTLDDTLRLYLRGREDVGEFHIAWDPAFQGRNFLFKHIDEESDKTMPPHLLFPGTVVEEIISGDGTTTFYGNIRRAGAFLDGNVKNRSAQNIMRVLEARVRAQNNGELITDEVERLYEGLVGTNLSMVPDGYHVIVRGTTGFDTVQVLRQMGYRRCEAEVFVDDNGKLRDGASVHTLRVADRCYADVDIDVPPEHLECVKGLLAVKQGMHIRVGLNEDGSVDLNDQALARVKAYVPVSIVPILESQLTMSRQRQARVMHDLDPDKPMPDVVLPDMYINRAQEIAPALQPAGQS